MIILYATKTGLALGAVATAAPVAVPPIPAGTVLELPVISDPGGLRRVLFRAEDLSIAAIDVGSIGITEIFGFWVKESTTTTATGNRIDRQWLAVGPGVKADGKNDGIEVTVPGAPGTPPVPVEVWNAGGRVLSRSVMPGVPVLVNLPSDAEYLVVVPGFTPMSATVPPLPQPPPPI
jgi:hypothetical protein